MILIVKSLFISKEYKIFLAILDFLIKKYIIYVKIQSLTKIIKTWKQSNKSF